MDDCNKGNDIEKNVEPAQVFDFMNLCVNARKASLCS